MNKEERILFYLGDIVNKNINKTELVTVNDIQLINPNVYNFHFKTLIDKNQFQNKKLNICFGDVQHKPSNTCLVKNRYNSNNGIILRCPDFIRHWSDYYKRPNDINYDDKISKVIWRGTTTGQPDRKANRFDLVTSWFDKHNDIDIGFSFICQEKDIYSKYVKGEMTIEQMLKFKYIISVQGNDKDSGLNWKLNSNSLVLMPKPYVESWLMESKLIPDYHYVLLKDDFSDLKEKLDWCNNNTDKCKNIIHNANTFMKQFENNEYEEELENEVLQRYFDLIE